MTQGNFEISLRKLLRSPFELLKFLIVMQNLREKEIQLLGKMLTLGSAGSGSSGLLAPSTDFADQWKVLIYDQEGRDIISPLLNVGALRQKGVTLHLQLHSDREPVPDAPAVYFVRPTEANVKRIADDCAKQMYRTVFINFISRVDRPVLEKLAQELVASNSVSMVSKIFDQFLDVIALEPYLFSLNIKDAFSHYNDPSLSEAQIRGFMTRVSMGLLSTVRTIGAIPVIRAPGGGAAEMLAREFNSTLREHLNARGPGQNLFEDSLVQDRARPLMLILERAQDLFPLLQHTSSYQALICDLLDFRLNRVSVDVPEKGGVGSKKKTYDLNTQSDLFLQRFAASPFPEAVENNERELADISQLEASLRSKHSATAIAAAEEAQNSNSGALSGSRAKDLSEALESLPEILHRKQMLEAHTNLMQAIMKQIAARDIPSFFELEQSLLTSGVRNMDRAAVLALLRDGSKGSLHDKARLLCILAVLGDPTSLSKVGAEEYDVALQQGCAAMPPAAATAPGTPTPSAGAALSGPPSPAAIAVTLASVNFLRRLVSLQQGSAGGGFGGLGMARNTSGAGGLHTFLASKYTSLMAKATSFFTKFTPYYATRVAHALAEGKGGHEDETYLTLDPRGNSGGASAAGGDRYSDIIVFVLGGGSYSEFYNLQELVIKEPGSAAAKESASHGMSTLRSVVYGCTDLLSGDDFLRQVERLTQGTSAATPSAPAK